MVVSTRPEGEYVLERPREVYGEPVSRIQPVAKRHMNRTISAVSINSLEQPQNDPNVNSDNVEVASKCGVEDGASEGSSTKNEYFGRVGIFSSKAKGCRVLVVQFVDMLVEDTSMERLVS